MAVFDRLHDDLGGIDDDDFVCRRFGWELAGGIDCVEVGEACPLKANHFGDYREDVAREMGYPRRCMSVGLHSVLIDYGFEPAKMLEHYPDYGLARMRVGDLRKLEKGNGDPCPQGVMPASESGEPWHAVVFDLSGDTRSKAAKEAILRCAQVVIPLMRHA